MYRSQQAVRQAEAPPGGVGRIFGRLGSLVVSAGRATVQCFGWPIWPDDTAIGNITFGRADTAAEPQCRQVPMSSLSLPGSKDTREGPKGGPASGHSDPRARQKRRVGLAGCGGG